VSVLLHELAHSFVARLYGIPVRDITLHMFGGVSNIEREPPTPRAELLIAIVGPLASFAIGAMLLFFGGGHRLAQWLGPINITLGVFNLIPGFPLDGGRILRSLLWQGTGDLKRATRWAGLAGQGVGWAFIALGAMMALGRVVPFFGTGIGGGLWLALIGMFLRNAAAQHLAGQALFERLEGVRVVDLMRNNGPWVEVSTPGSAAAHAFLSNDASAMPVFAAGRFVGILTLSDLRRARHLPAAYVRDLMTPLERLTVTTPDTALSEALRALAAAERDEVAVVHDGALAGMLFEQDIARWLELERTERPMPRILHRPHA